MQNKIDAPPIEQSKYIAGKTLEIILRQINDQYPYFIVKNFPGPDAEMTIEQVRKMASALLEAADECEKKFKKDSHFPPLLRSYPL